MRPSKYDLRQSRKRRIRARITGTAARPRLVVFCSLKRVYAQIVDDVAGTTLVAASSKPGQKNIAAAKKVGGDVASKAKEAKVTAVVFDRNARKYHGRIKALAEAARAGGLSF